ncbi:TetR/AcrR family transcriptional regulator [Maritimibacter sp. UBA3975]|uniref:TetR/AcrR family transcriptional regulator n=1 Tax=Maritimibacter sp. UBA3975 TaxID=1946833 RepID=UPI000C0A35E2|nr:TetR/AcrR family transcriptional regulator [Maritimibacter sp. UBA3975]MAM63260.1 TetR family transcriptional regulator [Maritimibacter sp.]|tara:strand:- start:14177 stop:14803 length:627 start_codon:yes stop_codon:yes gene_type:complete
MNRTPSRAPKRRTRRDEQRELTRGKLLEAARKLFRDYGYEDVSVTEIGKEAGVSHTLINAYFHGKAGLLYEIVRENNAPQWPILIEAAGNDDDPKDRLWNMLDIAGRKDGEDPRLLAVMQSYAWLWPEEIEVANRADRLLFKELIAKVIEAGQASGAFRTDIDPLQTARVIFAVYTWELRSTVFKDTSLESALANMRAYIGNLILVDH